MRRTCQVFLAKAIQQGLPAKRCGEPAVDFVTISYPSNAEESELLTTKVWMCAFHWDEYQNQGVK